MSESRHRNSMMPTLEQRIYWRRQYWLWAALPMLVLFVLEAGQILLFETTRAPNVNSAIQILLMLAFFGLWVAVPRIIWQQINRFSRHAIWWRAVLRLSGYGLILCAAHLWVLAWILRVMHSPPGWGMAHLGQSFAEVWFGYAGIWLLIYALSCAAIALTVRFHQPASGNTHPLAVRHAGATYYLQPEHIVWIEASGNYVKIFYHQSDRVHEYMLRQSLRATQRQLPEMQFIRTHRQALVNRRHIISIRPANGSQRLMLQLSHGMQAPLSRRQHASISERLAQGDSLIS